jgi:hypothetical protein
MAAPVPEITDTIAGTHRKLMEMPGKEIKKTAFFAEQFRKSLISKGSDYLIF